MSEKNSQKTLYVVRHGATAWNEQGRIVGHEDLGVSESGQRQAEGTARLLHDCRIDAARTSPLRRTRETADIILRGRSCSAEPDPRLIELRLGGWEGKTREELRSDSSWQQWVKAPHSRPTPEGEWLYEVQERALRALLDGLATVPAGGSLLLCTHGGVARVLMLRLLGLPLAAYHQLRCDCGSVSAFSLTDEAELHAQLVCNITEPLVALSGRPAL